MGQNICSRKIDDLGGKLRYFSIINLKYTSPSCPFTYLKINGKSWHLTWLTLAQLSSRLLLLKTLSCILYHLVLNSLVVDSLVDDFCSFFLENFTVHFYYSDKQKFSISKLSSVFIWSLQWINKILRLWTFTYDLYLMLWFRYFGSLSFVQLWLKIHRQLGSWYCWVPTGLPR